jgi:ComEC/Rec2-related protein
VIASPSAPPVVGVRQRPLFGGYLLVALVAALIAGIVLRGVGVLATVLPWAWLALALICGAVWVNAALIGRRSPRAGLRMVLVTGLLGMFVALGAARAAAADPSFDPAAISRLAHGEAAWLRGTVATEPDLRAGFRFLTVDVTAVSLDGGQTWQRAVGRVEAAVNGPDDWFAPAYGDAVELSGTLAPPGAGYSAPDVLARLTGNVRATVESRNGGNPLLAWLFDLRVRLAEAIQRALPEPEAALLIGILLGLKTPTLRARLPLFTATGTIHLVVPAGLKVATLAELASYSARRLGAWPRAVAALAAVGVYAALGGGGPAAIRAAIMGALLALAPALGRAYNVFTALALATLVMVVVEPAVIYDAGFQLTVLATFGLPLLVPPLQTWLAARLCRLPGAHAIAESLAVTVAAQLATMPVLALTFHQFSLIAPLANLLTVPLLAPLLVLGGLLALAALLAGGVGAVLTLALAWVTWPLLWFVDSVIAVCAGLPGAWLAIQNTPLVVAALYYGAVIVGLWRLWPLLRRFAASGASTRHGTPGHVRLSRRALVALLAVALLGSCGAAAPAVVARTARVDFLNVGPGGEAMLLRLPSGVTALVNGGPDGPTLESALAGKLPLWQRSFDLVALTDTRTGDVRGLQDLAAHFAIAHTADAGMAHPSTDYLAWLDASRRAGAAHTQVREGDVIQLDATTLLRVLAPPQTLYPPGEGDTTASNDLILRLETPGLRVLLLGAADAYALDALATAGEPLSADVVALALTPGAPLDLNGPLGAVLRAAHPRLVVITAAPVAPDSATAQRAATLYPWDADVDAATALNAYIYRVESAGTIELSGDAGGWDIV